MLHNPLAYEKKFDPDQPRDERGRFSAFAAAHGASVAAAEAIRHSGSAGAINKPTQKAKEASDEAFYRTSKGGHRANMTSRGHAEASAAHEEAAKLHTQAGKETDGKLRELHVRATTLHINAADIHRMRSRLGARL